MSLLAHTPTKIRSIIAENFSVTLSCFQRMEDLTVAITTITPSLSKHMIDGL